MKYRCLAMDAYSSEAGEERERPAHGAKPFWVDAVDENEALDLASDHYEGRSYDFIKVEFVQVKPK
jgi:hypothetical protein